MLGIGFVCVGAVCGWLAVMLGRGNIGNERALVWVACISLALFFLFPSGILALLGGLVAGATARLLFVQEITRSLED